MKKYVIGCFAIAIAIVAFAFTPSNKAAVNCQPNTEYVWFNILTSASLPCAQPSAPINPLVIDITDHFTSSSTSITPLADLDADGFKIKEADFLVLSPSCVTGSAELCGVAYLQTDVTTAKFEKVVDATSPTGFSWRPKSQANGGPTPVCYVCRP